MNTSKESAANGKWAVATAVLQQVKEDMQGKGGAGSAHVDPHVLQQLSLATHKADDTERGLNAFKRS